MGRESSEGSRYDLTQQLHSYMEPDNSKYPHKTRTRMSSAAQFTTAPKWKHPR